MVPIRPAIDIFSALTHLAGLFPKGVDHVAALKQSAELVSEAKKALTLIDPKFPRDARKEALDLFKKADRVLVEPNQRAKQYKTIAEIELKRAEIKIRQAIQYCELGNASAAETIRKESTKHFETGERMQLQYIENMKKPDLFVPRPGCSIPSDDSNKYILAAAEQQSFAQTKAEYEALVQQYQDLADKLAARASERPAG